MIDQITENLYISDAASVLYNTHKLLELKVGPRKSFLKDQQLDNAYPNGKRHVHPGT